MIQRHLQAQLASFLREFPAVAILGPRQVGKTTLAMALGRDFTPAPVYLDLESPGDQAKLAGPETYFSAHDDRLVILDEIQRVPGLFPILRGVIDGRRREGRNAGQFLILGSASLDLLRQSSESLAGRIAFAELPGLTLAEVGASRANALWLRGGFPDSLLAPDDAASLRWRANFIATYLERDVPQFGSRIPAVALRRLWTMLAHSQGEQLNLAKLATSLDVSQQTTKRYIDLLEDLLLVRRLPPWSGNVKKRLVKTPKTYIRDSGLTHALLNLRSLDDVLGHPVAGASWEGFAIENILASVPTGTLTSFYRTSAGAEADLVLERGRQRIAIEVKRSMAPVVSKGFHDAARDVEATRRYVAYPGAASYPVADAEVMPLDALAARVQSDLGGAS